MKIVDSSISMTSHHTLSKTSLKFDTSNFWTGFDRILDEKNQQVKTENDSTQKVLPVHIHLTGLVPKVKIEGQWYRVKVLKEVSEVDRQKMLMLERIINALTGKRVRFRFQQSPGYLVALIPESNKINKVNDTVSQPNFGIKHNEYQRETEALSFVARGFFKTADGKEVNFTTDFNLSREFAALNNINTQTGTPIDPLIINYAGPAASLTNTKFSFDLDTDGKAEQISFVNNGSGFLALDNNDNGLIDDGSELFGVKSGNGFNELAAYDLDKNNWLDENDDIFDRLRIWTKDQDGNDNLFALGQKGVGAIYLGNIEAPFSYKNEQNRTLGENQRAGLFAREDGMVGTIQQANLMV